MLCEREAFEQPLGLAQGVHGGDVVLGAALSALCFAQPCIRYGVFAQVHIARKVLGLSRLLFLLFDAPLASQLPLPLLLLAVVLCAASGEVHVLGHALGGGGL